MVAINRALDLQPRFGFAIPVSKQHLGRVIAWLGKNANLGGMVLMKGEVRFAEAQYADAFAEEIGAGWNIRD